MEEGGMLVEAASIAGVSAMVAFLGTTLFANVLNFFVALKAEPLRRAQLTVGIPAFLVSAGMTVATLTADTPPGIMPMSLVAFLVFAFSLAGSWPVYWYFLRDYRRNWVDDPADLPEGVGLAEDNWKVGLTVLLVIAAALVVRALFKTLVET